MQQNVQDILQKYLTYKEPEKTTERRQPIIWELPNVGITKDVKAVMVHVVKISIVEINGKILIHSRKTETVKKKKKKSK